MFNCFKCGQKLETDLHFCTECGLKQVLCPHCNTKTLAKYSFCCNCGTTLTSSLPDSSKISRGPTPEIQKAPLPQISEELRKERLLIVRTPSRPEIAGTNFLVRVNLGAPRFSINNVHVRLLFDPEVLNLVKCDPESKTLPGQTYFATLLKDDKKTSKFYFKPKEICGHTTIEGDIVFYDPTRMRHTEPIKEIVINPCDYIKPKTLPFDKLVEQGGLTPSTVQFPYVGSPENISTTIIECINTSEVEHGDTKDSIASKSTGVTLNGSPILVSFLINKLLKTIDLTMRSTPEDQDMLVKLSNNVESLLEQVGQLGLMIDNVKDLSQQHHQALLGKRQFHFELIPAQLMEEFKQKVREEISALNKEQGKDLIYVEGELLDGGFIDEEGGLHVSSEGFKFGLTVRNFSPQPLTIQKLNFPHLHIQAIHTNNSKGTPGKHSAYVTDEDSVLVLEPLVGETFFELQLLPLQKSKPTLPSCTLLAGTQEYYVCSDIIDYVTHDHLTWVKLAKKAKQYGKFIFKYGGSVAKELVGEVLY